MLSDTEGDDNRERTHAIMFELFPGDAQGSYETRLETLGHWYLDASVEGVGLHREADSMLYY